MAVAAIFFFLGRIVWENWEQVREAAFSFRAIPLLLSTLIFVLGYFIQVWAWYLITLRLGIALSPGETVANWFYSQMGKYLPGKVWLLLGRFYLYDSKGKSKKAITVALYLETVTLILAAGLVFLVSLLSLKEVRSFPIGIPLAGVILLLLVSFLFLHPRVLEKIFNRVLARLKSEPFPLPLSYSDVLWVLAVCILSWVVGGFGFYLFVDSVFTVSPKDVYLLTGALAVSNTAGLLALFAPSGLGVREGVLVLLLSSIMPSSVAVVLSILTRLWMTFIEIGLIGVVYLIHSLRRRG
jgi:uncharacterized membrane protein YbhN (UPF0104 family)